MGERKRGLPMEDRILIVDDEEMICSVMSRRLTREGYVCVTAQNGEGALRHFYKDSFSLIISDIKMPEMDGIELLKEVKAVHPGILMIMVTAYPEIDLALEAMRLGAYDFIIKPADLELVILSVKRAFEKKRLEEELEIYHKHLGGLVEERPVKLQQAYRTLKKAYLDS